ncbi:uncharacterized protein CBL_03811 [Carabus blaptoides fortunei]
MYTIQLSCCILVVLSVEFVFTEPEIPHNPCPNLFRYYSEGDQWYGNVTIPTPTSSPAVFRISFSIEDINIQDYGSIDFYKPVNILDHLKNNDPFVYKVRLPQSNYLPRVTSIKFKNIVLCTGPELGAPSASFWLEHSYRWSFTLTPTIYEPAPTRKPQTTRQPVTTSVLTRKPTTTIAPITRKSVVQTNVFRNSDECGKIRTTRATKDFVPYIYRGTPVARNEHPWLVALFEEKNGNPLTFFCGGNLISTKHVLTAAHCVYEKNNIQIKIGAHNNMQAFELGAYMRTVRSVIAHPEYATNSAHADISIAVLSEALAYSQTIKPVCLWNDDNELNDIVGMSGTIMGWGLNEKGETTATPVKTEVEVVSQQDCQQIELLRSATSDRTFCAGTKGTGPCLGDSGGGLYIIRDGRWYLRGIISVSVGDNTLQTCDVDTYSVYADTSQYLNWIVDTMK